MERERVKLNNVALDVLFKMKSNSGEGEAAEHSRFSPSSPGFDSWRSQEFI